MSDSLTTRNAGIDAIPEQSRTKKAFIYARVSTDDSDQTVENQIPICMAYCESKNWEVVEVFSEEYTGSTINRPEFSRMLGQIDILGIDYVVVYDASRLTRCKDSSGNIQKVLDLINRRGAEVRYASMDIEQNSIAREMLDAVSSVTNAQYNIELSRKTTIGMQTKRAQGPHGHHMGLPARFMFVEDIATAPEGRFQEPDDKRGIVGTKTVTEEYLMSLAREGVPLAKAAKLIGVSANTLVAEMKPREQNPRRRLKKVAKAKARDPSYQIKDTDYVYFYRFKGTKDRYTLYMTLYEEAIKARKGVSSERVGNEVENASERVVGE